MERRRMPTEINLQMQISKLSGALGITQYSFFILQMRKTNSRELLLNPFVGLTPV